ncbi:MAG: divergent polysaccharide deacetylase family protein [bacterium]
MIRKSKVKSQKSKGILFLVIFLCLAGWVLSILWIERSNQIVLKKIDQLSNRLLSLEERLKEKEKTKEKVSLSIPKEESPSFEKPSLPIEPSIPEGGPPCKIAIILDDAGYKLSNDSLNLIKNGFPLTISILPHLPFSKETAEIVRNNGGEVMLHLPMEAKNGIGGTEGVIKSDMTQEKIKEITEKAIESIPYCVGVNNHMGSKATSDKETMEPVLSVIKEKNLYFVDSLTSSKSIAYKLAKDMGLKAGKRDIFIDNNNEESFVLFYLQQLIKVARKKGSAIGIGHIYKKATISVLERELPNLQNAGIELVPVSSLVKQEKND